MFRFRFFPVFATVSRILGEVEPFRGVKNTGILLAKIKKLTNTRNLVKFSAKSAFKLYVKFYWLIDLGEANGLLP